MTTDPNPNEALHEAVANWFWEAENSGDLDKLGCNEKARRLINGPLAAALATAERERGIDFMAVVDEVFPTLSEWALEDILRRDEVVKLLEEGAAKVRLKAFRRHKKNDIAEAAPAAHKARIETLEAALRPFAEITPSTLHPDDGREAEPYSIVLAHPKDEGDFTGADLARARAALADPQQQITGGGDAS